MYNSLIVLSAYYMRGGVVGARVYNDKIEMVHTHVELIF